MLNRHGHAGERKAHHDRKHPRSLHQPGEHWSVNADWLGPWIGVLPAPLCGLAALLKAYANKRPQTSKPGAGLSLAA